MTNTPALRERLDVAPAPSRESRYELTVEELLDQRKKIIRLMQSAMVEGEHYGKIPGVPKPSLWQSGAQMLDLLFRLDPEFAAIETRDGKHLTIQSTCTIWHIPTGQRFGSGMGSCSTLESKYAYRQGQRSCPDCGATAILRSKFADNTGDIGWYCFAKRGGCGSKFPSDAFDAHEQLGRVPNEDIADTYNTILKMANKRALVAAVLNVTAASDVFTQDMEDHRQPVDDGGGDGAWDGPAKDVTPAAAPRRQRAPASGPARHQANPWANFLDELDVLMTALGADKEEVSAALGIEPTLKAMETWTKAYQAPDAALDAIRNAVLLAREQNDGPLAGEARSD